LFYNGKKAIFIPLAPVEVEILLCWGSAQKIATEDGRIFQKIPNLSATKNNQTPFN